jgi:GNAT superfamily N-acetyltransferase
MAEEKLEISPLFRGHVEAAYALSTAAGWNQTREDWRTVLHYANGLAFGGFIGERLVVTGAVARQMRCGWVGMVLVDEAYRRRGFASMMMDVLLKGADELGVLHWLGLDATDLGRPLYLKKGFKEVGTVRRWQLARPHDPLPMLTVKKFHVGSKSIWDLLKLDTEATGRDRLRLVMSPYMLDDGVVCEREEGVAGFGMCRPGRLGPYVGPVVARNEDIAAGIISKLLEPYQPREDSPIFIDVPEGSSIEPWLKQEGFEVVRSWTRMVRGNPEIGKPEMIFAIAGPELG